MRIVLGLLLCVLVGPAWAQPVQRLHGVVVSLDAAVLTVRAEDDALLRLVLPADIRIGAVRERSLADIKPGEYVGSAAVRGRDGKLHAEEVHIFPDAMRGAGEGHRPMDRPEQTMTNATVGDVSELPVGRTLRLRYPDGEQTIEVGPDVRVVGMITGDRGLLVAGAAVTIRAATGADGSLTVVSITAEKDGVKPLP